MYLTQALKRAVQINGNELATHDHDRIRRGLWYKYDQGYDEIKSNGMIISGKRLANLNISFNIIIQSSLIIYKL